MRRPVQQTDASEQPPEGDPGTAAQRDRRALATSSLRAGHSVVLTATEPGRAREAAEQVGAGAADSNAAAARSAEVVILAVPAACVVKAFNTALAARQADPVVDGVRLDGYVAGDDAEAKNTVLRLVESIGFVPIDAVPLAMARVLEGMALLNISLNIRSGWPWQDGWKLVGPTGSS